MKKLFSAVLSYGVCITAISMLIASCGSKPASATALVGTYDAKSPFATEVLELDASGTFKQQVTLSDSGKLVSTSGRWTFDAADGSVCFESGFILVMTGLRELSPDADKPKSGSMVYDARASLGTIYIGDEEYVLYKRR